MIIFYFYVQCTLANTAMVKTGVSKPKFKVDLWFALPQFEEWKY